MRCTDTWTLLLWIMDGRLIDVVVVLVDDDDDVDSIGWGM